METLWFLLNCEDQFASPPCVNSRNEVLDCRVEWARWMHAAICSVISLKHIYHGFFCFVEVRSPSYHSVRELV